MTQHRRSRLRPLWTVVPFLLLVAVGTAGLVYVTNPAPARHGATADALPDDEDDLDVPPDDETPSDDATSARPAPARSTARPGGVLWAADTGKGTRAFEGVEKAPGNVTVVTDPQGRYGPSFRFETWQNPDGTKARCESRGMRKPDGTVLTLGGDQEGQTFYLGWRSLWSPMPTQSGAWLALFQMHVSGVGSGGPNVGPFVLRTLGDGQLHFQLIAPDGSDRHIWTGPLRVNTWNSFVIGFKLSRHADGWVEFWYNGAQQRFANGATRYPATTLWGTHDNVKWGVYRSGANHTGNAVAYLNHAQLGTTYPGVAP